jgi:hypothetical protein
MKKWLTSVKWAFIKLIIGNEPIIMNCTIQGKGIKKGWSFLNYSNPEKSIILWGRIEEKESEK